MFRKDFKIIRVIRIISIPHYETLSKILKSQWWVGD